MSKRREPASHRAPRAVRCCLILGSSRRSFQNLIISHIQSISHLQRCLLLARRSSLRFGTGSAAASIFRMKRARNASHTTPNLPISYEHTISCCWQSPKSPLIRILMHNPNPSPKTLPSLSRPTSSGTQAVAMHCLIHSNE